MNRNMVYRYVPVLAAVAALGFAATAARADHRDRDCRDRPSIQIRVGDFGLRIGGRERRCIPGYYEERTERVLVEQEHNEQRWVPAVYEIRYEGRGRHCRERRVCVREGYYETYCVPARYELRTVRVWVPERWEECESNRGYRD